MRLNFLILLFIFLPVSAGLGEGKKAQVCGFENFQSTALKKDSPEGLRDETGNWISDTRGLVAIGKCREKQWGSLFAQFLCPRNNKLTYEMIIPKVRIIYNSGEPENINSVDVSKHDYDWLITNGWLNQKDRWGTEGVQFYVQCK